MAGKETTTRTRVPVRLTVLAQQLVGDSWFQDVNDLMVDALRRFLETHGPELT